MPKYKLKNPSTVFEINGERRNAGNLTDEIIDRMISRNSNYSKYFVILQDQAQIEIAEAEKELKEARDIYEELTGNKAGRKSLERLKEDISNYKQTDDVQIESE